MPCTTERPVGLGGGGIKAMIRALLVLTTAFLFVSSTLADALGLQSARTAAFIAVAGGLIALSWASRPLLPRAEGALALGFVWLLSLAALANLGAGVNPLDLKVLLPILAVASGPALRHGLQGWDPARLLQRLLGLYVLGSFAFLLSGAPGAAVRGYGKFVRQDVSGSLVLHASLCTLAVLLSSVALAQRRHVLIWAWHAAVLGAALAMLLMGATRTTLVTLALYGLFSLIAGPDRSKLLLRMSGAALAGSLMFAAYSTLWSDAFLARLISSEQESYTSGRAESVAAWLGMAVDKPLGLGIGAVRDTLADGRPTIEGGGLLEWPHNEVVRFYVEGGVFGMALILGLLATVVRTALRAAGVEGNPRARALLLAVAADTVAQSLLQNYLNGVYHATVLLLFLTATAAKPVTPHEREGRGSLRSRFLLNWTPDQVRGDESRGDSGSENSPTMPEGSR